MIKRKGKIVTRICFRGWCSNNSDEADQHVGLSDVLYKIFTKSLILSGRAKYKYKENYNYIFIFQYNSPIKYMILLYKSKRNDNMINIFKKHAVIGSKVSSILINRNMFHGIVECIDDDYVLLEWAFSIYQVILDIL